jgi:hypothetical protein
MDSRRIFLAAVIIGSLAFADEGIPQTTKSKVFVDIASGPHVIHVDKSAKCVDQDSLPALPNDTVDFQAQHGVSDFHVIFIHSPFVDHQTVFDKNHHKSKAIAIPPNLITDFKYIIVAEGSEPCDPHVIVVHGAQD